MRNISDKGRTTGMKRIDPIETFRKDLISTNIALKEELDDIVRTSQELILKIYKLARDERISPRMDLKKNPNLIGNLMFSNKRIEKMENRECEVLTPKADNPRIQQLKHKSRFAIKEGKPISKIKAYQIRDGIFEAVLDKFYVDPTLIAYGEDNRDWGGAFGVYRGLSESIPYHRLLMHLYQKPQL